MEISSFGREEAFVNWSYENPQEICQSDMENFHKTLQSIMGGKKELNLCTDHMKKKKKTLKFHQKVMWKNLEIHKLFTGKNNEIHQSAAGKICKIHQASIYKTWVLAIGHKKKPHKIRQSVEIKISQNLSIGCGKKIAN